jgi:hypothetical protein
MIRQAGIRQVRANRAGVGPENALTFTSGLTRVGDTITNDLVTGKAGGQTVTGGTGAGDNLTLQSTTNATRGLVVVSDTLVNLIADAGTTTAPDGTIFRHTSSGAPGAGFGLTLATELHSSTNVVRRAATDVVSWTVATNGAEVAQRKIQLMTGGVLQDVVTMAPAVTTVLSPNAAVIGSGAVLNVASSSTSASIQFLTGSSTVRGGIRADSAGNFSWVANAGHFLFVGGDFGVGQIVQRIFSNGNVVIKTNAVSVQPTDNGYKLEVAAATLGSLFSVADALTNTTQEVLTRKHTSSGTTAAGFGVLEAVDLQSAAGTLRRVTTTATTLTVATDAAEEGQCTYNVMQGGALQSCLTIGWFANSSLPYLLFGAPGNGHGIMRSGNTLVITIASSQLFTWSAASVTSSLPLLQNERVAVSPPATSSGAVTKLSLTPGADTGTTLSTEAIDADFNLSRTRTWATGAIATQRAFLVRAPTYAFVGASTITTAATLAILAAPTAGANATITNAYALWVQAGLARFDGNAICPTLSGGNTAATNLVLQSTTHATRGAIVCNDPVGVGRNPGTVGGPPQFAVAGGVTVASSAGATLDYVVVNTSTMTITGATNITTALGFNYVSLEPPSYSTTVTIGAGGTTPAAATLAIKGAPTITGGGAFAGSTGAVGLWVQATSYFTGALTAATSVTTPLLTISATSTSITLNSVVLDPGAGGTVTIANNGGLTSPGVISVGTGVGAGVTALSLTGLLKLLTDTAANGTGAAVTLPNFGGAGRPVAGTPAGWWHIQQSGNDRYVPFWGP